MDDDQAARSQVAEAEGDEPLVLIVEDEFLLKCNLEEALSEAGFNAIAVENADEAVLALEENPARFRALITDIRMPGTADGWDLARRARELQPIIPVIYMTGDSAKDWAAQGVPKSIFLQKPFVHAQLVTALTTLINEAGMNEIGQ